MSRKRIIAGALSLIVVAIGAGAVGYSRKGEAEAQAHIQFNRDIRPILNGNCMACHGGVKQAGNVSFSYREQALGKGKSGRPTVVPGSPGQSELIARVASTNPETRMPLHRAALKPEQIALLRQWIEEGAPWENYWAFIPPRPQPLPEVKKKQWVRQPVDRFILARLEAEKLQPMVEADRAALLRRVSLDLTGLPPTPAEQARFLADAAPAAYEKEVDRLLASPRFGERWASMWLDLARYGDSKGFEKDRERPGTWTYRDWVVDALNANMPYNDFVIRQIAGDLLPNAKFSDRIATAFHRQTPANDEGGTDDEEFRLQAVMDRASTTWSVLNGVSFNCVQCHSHPYDPIRHNEYYKFLAFFNTSRDADIAFDQSLDEDWPVLKVPTAREKFSEADQLQRQISGLRDRLVAMSRSAFDATHWKPLPILKGSVTEALAIERAIGELRQRPGGAGREKQIAQLADQLAIARKAPPKAGFRLRDGMAEQVGTVPMNSVYEFTSSAPLTRLTALQIAVPPANSEKAVHSPEKGFVSNRMDAWIIRPDGTSEKILFHAMAPDAIDNVYGNMARVLRNTASQGDPGLAMERYVANAGLMANPSLSRTRWVVAVPQMPLEIPKGSRVRVQLTHTELINAASSAPPRVSIYATDDARWTQLAKSAAFAAGFSQLEIGERRLAKIPSVSLPVMVEQSSFERRHTLEFDRGSFLTQAGPALKADVPAIFGALPAGAPRDRLTMARWFFSPGQPLTARVAVNRYWEQLFGTGLVETLEDFGSAGELPSHPELLDWLALHFQNDLHWNTKALLRELVTSATYRQKSATNARLQERDPRNRLLAHGPQQRLTAEMVRDQALLASGLINEKMGGPPVRPLQPEGVWNVDANNPERWVNSKGADRYRRALYTFIKRTATYPSFMTFDAADRQLSVPRRLPTNTPLQALVTLNDPVFQQAAEALSARMAKQGGGVDQEIQLGARWVLSRDLRDREMTVMRGLYKASGMTAVASALFNLDAALTR